MRSEKIFFFLALLVIAASLSSFILYAIIGVWILQTLYKMFSLHDVKNRNVLITGGGSGLGRRMALGFALEGCNIILWDINADGLKKVSQEVRDLGAECYTFEVNVSNYKAVQEATELTLQKVQTVDVLINNAGIVSGKFCLELTEEQIRRTFDVNVMGVFWTIKTFLPKMYEHNSGTIVNIASAGGLEATTALTDYCASKFAVVGATEALRRELKEKNKNINTLLVCPFYINTGMFEGAKPAFLLPILEEEKVANDIVMAVKRRDELLVTPALVRVTWFGKALLPVWLHDMISKWLGLTSGMEEFIGRK